MSEQKSSTSVGFWFLPLLWLSLLIGLFLLLSFVGGCQRAEGGEGLREGFRAVVQEVKGAWGE